eukprot:2875094-Pleurochrysis_carterae.AAC.1
MRSTVLLARRAGPGTNTIAVMIGCLVFSQLSGESDDLSNSAHFVLTVRMVASFHPRSAD